MWKFKSSNAVSSTVTDKFGILQMKNAVIMIDNNKKSHNQYIHF